jgi:hypothetical protein
MTFFERKFVFTPGAWGEGGGRGRGFHPIIIDIGTVECIGTSLTLSIYRYKPGNILSGF